MKFVVCFAVLAVASAARVPRQAAPDTPSVDIGSALVSQLGTFTRQVSGIQSVLSDLNGQVNRMILTGSRLVAGQASGEGPASVGDNAIQALTQVTSQFQAMQRVLSDLSAQLNRMIASSTRLVAGQSSGDGPASIGDNAIQSLAQVTGQLASVQRVLSDLSQQLNRMIQTGSRLVAGQEAGSGSPAEAALSTLSQITAQFAAAQRVLSELNSQLNRMIQSSTRLVAGLEEETTTTAAPAGPNPAEAALQAVNQFTQQFASMQRVLGELSGQLNRMITTGTRLVAGK